MISPEYIAPPPGFLRLFQCRALSLDKCVDVSTDVVTECLFRPREVDTGAKWCKEFVKVKEQLGKVTQLISVSTKGYH